MKKFHLIGTRTRDLPACSIVPQPTTLPRAPLTQGGVDMTRYYVKLQIMMRCHGTDNLAEYVPDTNQYTATFSNKITATLQWTKIVLYFMCVIYTRLKITPMIRGVYNCDF
jgi:hypothetical protein